MVDSGNREHRVTRATLTSQLEDAIRVEIIEGVLPPGHRLRAQELTQRYGVSATPLREALQRLAAENLVEIDPRLGAAVAEISRSDLRDIYWLRELLEGIALERSIQRADGSWETDVRAAWDRFRETPVSEPGSTEGMLAWSGAHRAFHEACSKRATPRGFSASSARCTTTPSATGCCRSVREGGTRSKSTSRSSARRSAGTRTRR